MGDGKSHFHAQGDGWYHQPSIEQSMANLLPVLIFYLNH